MKKVLITGKNGYIGTNFANYMSQKYSNDFVVDKISLRDDSWKEKDLSCYDAAVYLAGIAHVDVGKVSDEEKQKYFDINAKLAEEFCEKVQKDGIKYFYYISSFIIYGDKSFSGKSDKAIDKMTIPIPDNFYGESKLSGEEKIKKVCKNNNWGIIRLPMVYGKDCKGNFQTLIKIAKKVPAFPKYEKQQKSAIYIDNLCEFIKVIIENNMTGVFYPQNKEYFNTYKVVKILNEELRKSGKTKNKIIFIGGFTKLIDLLASKVKLIDKAFGSLRCDKKISDIGINYNIVDFEESVRRSV